MGRLLLALASAAVLAAAVYGAAASLGGINSQELGAEDADVTACDSNGITVTPQTGLHAGTDLGHRVDYISVGGLADACFGKNMRVVVSSASDWILAFSSTVGNNLGGNSYFASPDNNTQNWFVASGFLTGGNGLSIRDVEKIQIVIS